MYFSLLTNDLNCVAFDEGLALLDWFKENNRENQKKNVLEAAFR